MDVTCHFCNKKIREISESDGEAIYSYKIIKNSIFCSRECDYKNFSSIYGEAKLEEYKTLMKEYLELSLKIKKLLEPTGV